ncbi:hypothetical protein [Halomarina ordinaria]|uniref:DUF8081 domain-containing protein n=1 Tax=Halomarina ordinaria TaxID=3033939 RepID=A0ABD5U8R0_9EURY|nr:hypothetical protein [Halomarina sp. PSRA2]
MSESTYTVAVKPSARRRSAAAGRWVNDRGPRRRFETKALARQWARELSTHSVTLWVQDAAPNDPAPVDGYLVARRGPSRESTTGGEQATFPHSHNGF